MFSDLLKIVKLCGSAVKDISLLKTYIERKSALLEMLKTYFLLLDTHEDGLKLLDSVRGDTIEHVKGLSEEVLEAKLKIWDSVLRRQSARLYEIQSYILSNSYIAVINPDDQKSIDKVIGYKMDRLVTLHGLGAGLFFRSILLIEESPEDIASLVLQVLTKQESGVIDHESVKNKLELLYIGLSEFRKVINEFAEKNEIIALAEKAIKETEFEV